MRIRIRKGRLILWYAAILMVGFSVVPFMWFLVASFKAPIEITSVPLRLLPSLSLDSYVSAIERHSLLHYLVNSAVVSSVTTIIGVTLSLMASYALARIPLRINGFIFGSFLVVSMFPQISMAGPIWRLMKAFGWLNTYQGVILPYVALTLPIGIWVLTATLKELPEQLEEAAQLDGCTKTQVMLRIVLPLAAPGLFTAAILIFIFAWNEFFFALLILTEHKFQTLPIGIALFQGQYTIPWGEIAAASAFSTVPLVVMVWIFQRRIMEGLTAGALKA
jgi:multiple sugar transport system permease protein